LGQAIKKSGGDRRCFVSKHEGTDNEITVGMGARNAPAGRETR
jgi:hypothetical protein